MSQPLSEEVLKRIEENKAKALARLAEKRNREQTSETNEPADSAQPNADDNTRASKRRARWAKPIFEYDLSQMVDTRAGFLADEDGKNDENRKKFEEKAHKVDLNPRKTIDTLDVDFYNNRLRKITFCNCSSFNRSESKSEMLRV
jgi:hypothetical protein